MAVDNKSSGTRHDLLLLNHQGVLAAHRELVHQLLVRSLESPDIAVCIEFAVIHVSNEKAVGLACLVCDAPWFLTRYDDAVWGHLTFLFNTPCFFRHDSQV